MRVLSRHQAIRRSLASKKEEEEHFKKKSQHKQKHRDMKLDHLFGGEAGKKRTGSKDCLLCSGKSKASGLGSRISLEN